MKEVKEAVIKAVENVDVKELAEKAGVFIREFAGDFDQVEKFGLVAMIVNAGMFVVNAMRRN